MLSVGNKTFEKRSCACAYVRVLCYNSACVLVSSSMGMIELKAMEMISGKMIFRKGVGKVNEA